ncbi:hypothetical protein RFI_09710 [Reticulomyxa filosa]|uniref:EF-hand domain-containing protein n=1 Tax=Reticulomyxa filosa TaxID=46433 RepID=X6NP20_RETFI|nr:hypothetical protein RFI_09710 [Reticulomyxa filosa]|eukprot:ETO27424.1 hypothetical protein RFI_09710 [Reticulomyxa filosa]
MDLDESNSGRLDFPEFCEGIKMFYSECSQQECKYVFDMFVEMQQKDASMEDNELFAMQQMLKELNSNHSPTSPSLSDTQSQSQSQSQSQLPDNTCVFDSTLAFQQVKKRTLSSITELRLHPFLQRIRKYAIDMDSIDRVIKYIFDKMLPVAKQTRVYLN